MKKFINALLGAALVMTISTGTAHAAESPKPKVTEEVGYLKQDPKPEEKVGRLRPNGSTLTKYGKRTSLGQEARKRVGHGGSCLRLDRHTVVCYVGTTKLKYAGTARSKPSKTSTTVVVRSHVKSNRFHVYRFNTK